MTTWKDTTSHSQSATDRTAREWTLQTSKLRIVLHRHIHADPSDWFVSCHDLAIATRPIESIVLAAAQAEAIEVVRQRLDSMRDSFAEVGA